MSEIQTGQNILPCGCVEREFGDGRKEVMPCPPHGILEAGRNLMQAGNLLGLVAQRLLQEQQRQSASAVEAAIRGAAKN
jgi:hypothetical protein